MRRPLFFITLVLAMTAAATAQSLTVALLQHSTDNLFQTRYGKKDSISNFSFSLDQPLRPFSFFSEGAYSYLAENTGISSYSQDVGLEYLRAAGGKTALYASVKAGGAIYREEYRDYNYFDTGFLGAVKSYLTPSSIVKFTYAFKYQAYAVDQFDFLSQLVIFSADKYFSSRTTLKAEGAYGYKYFLHPFAAEETLTEPTGLGSSGSGRGQMRGAGQFGQGGSLFVTDGPRRGSGIQIASVSGLIAQGLGNKIGIRLSGFRQWTLSGQNPFSSVDEFYMVENPTYDIFSWNGYGLSAEATFEAPWNSQLKLGYSGFAKEFPGIEAIDLAGMQLGPMRLDTRNQLEARLEKDFTKFTLYAYYSYIDNASNDPLFDWQGHFFGVSVEWRLNWGKGR